MFGEEEPGSSGGSSNPSAPSDAGMRGVARATVSSQSACVRSRSFAVSLSLVSHSRCRSVHASQAADVEERELFCRQALLMQPRDARTQETCWRLT